MNREHLSNPEIESFKGDLEGLLIKHRYHQVTSTEAFMLADMLVEVLHSYSKLQARRAAWLFNDPSSECAR